MGLFYKKYGTTGTPLFILHGLFGMSDNWHNVAKYLAENYMVYTIDLRNHGQSPHVSEMNYSLMSEDINNLLEEEQLAKVILMVHSMGGKVAMQFAVNYPEKLYKLIVVDIAPKRYAEGHKKYFEAMKSINFKAGGRKEIETELAKSIKDQGELLFLLKNLYRKEDNSYGLKLNLGVIEANYQEIIGGIKFVKTITVPTCFIKGERSSYIVEADENEIRKYFEDVRIVTVPNAGHWVHAENMSGFLTALEGFLKLA